METNKEFIPYQQALELKELGFDEPCFGSYVAGQLLITNDTVYNSIDIPVFKAPLFQQAFRWFRDKHELTNWVYNSHMDKFYYTILQEGRIVKAHNSYKTYEEAELACLKKLIEIVKNK